MLCEHMTFNIWTYRKNHKQSENTHCTQSQLFLKSTTRSHTNACINHSYDLMTGACNVDNLSFQIGIELSLRRLLEKGIREKKIHTFLILGHHPQPHVLTHTQNFLPSIDSCSQVRFFTLFHKTLRRTNFSFCFLMDAAENFLEEYVYFCFRFLNCKVKLKHVFRSK